MAYALGFFAADGTMIANNRGAHFIEFHITDKIILTRLRKVFGSNHKIAIRDRSSINPVWKVGYRLQIGSKTWFSDLERLGFSSNKSNVLSLPTIPPKFIGDFVRGYFDGDGCVHFRKYYAADRNAMRWSFSTRFTCGSKGFLVALHTALQKRGIQKGFITRKWNNKGYELVLSHKDSLALYALMYDTVSATDLFLPRKHKLFRKAIETLYPMRE